MSGSKHKLKSITDQLVADCASYILDELEESLGARITYAASNECTIKFSDVRLGSLRIASVAVNPTYICRWNLFTGDNIPTQGKYKSHWYDINEAHHFIPRIQQYLDTILANQPENPKSVYGHTDLDVPLDSYTNLPEEN